MHASSPSDRKVYNNQDPNKSQDIPVVFVDESHRLSVEAGAGPDSRWLAPGDYTDIRFRVIEAIGSDVVLTAVISEGFTLGADLAGKTLPDGRALHGIFTALEFTGGDLVCYS